MAQSSPVPILSDIHDYCRTEDYWLNYLWDMWERQREEILFMATIQTNIQRVRKSVADTQGRYAIRTRALARKMAAAARDNIRANISRPTFPGYAITGALAKKVVASEPTKSGSGWVATVRVQLTGKQAKYAAIHETGGTITAKRAPYLVFNIPGVGWRRVKSVRITRKRYFAKGIETTRREWGASRAKQEF